MIRRHGLERIQLVVVELRIVYLVKLHAQVELFDIGCIYESMDFIHHVVVWHSSHLVYFYKHVSVGLVDECVPRIQLLYLYQNISLALLNKY